MSGQMSEDHTLGRHGSVGLTEPVRNREQKRARLG